MRREFEAMRTGTPFDENRFMIDYTKGTGTSDFTPCADPIADAKSWLHQAMNETLPVAKTIPTGEAEEFGQWSPAQITTEWKTVEWTIPADKLKDLKRVLFTYVSGNHRLEIQEVAIIADGKKVAEDRHFGYAGKPDSRNSYQLKIPHGTKANNSCVIRATVRGGGGTDSKGSVGLITDRL
jgi:alpha-N-acetylglucosaminidase